jgi:Entner-Doudoroff aldolase
VDIALQLGAVFTVSPGFDEEVAAYSLENGLPHLPGVATATEIQAALRQGFGWLKAFPAAELGPAWFRAMCGPFPRVRFVATGGITPDSFQTYLDAGAAAVSFGSAVESLSREVVADLGTARERDGR